MEETIDFNNIPNIETFKHLIIEEIPVDSKGKHTVFWDSAEISESYNHIAPGTKGFVCLGCEPGSAPRPFIVISNDTENEMISVIFPHISLVDIKENRAYLIMGGDTHKETKNLQLVSEKYIIMTYPYSFLKYDYNKALDFRFGCFGNYGLPHIQYENYCNDLSVPSTCGGRVKGDFGLTKTVFI